MIKKITERAKLLRGNAGGIWGQILIIEYILTSFR